MCLPDTVDPRGPKRKRLKIPLNGWQRLWVVVLMAGSTLGALAAKRATTAVPIVFVSLIDPVASALVARSGIARTTETDSPGQPREPPARP
jgi:hypothetical protein